MQKIFHEIELFYSRPLNMRVLLLTNLIYAAVLPIVNIFSNAYILRSSNGDLTDNIIYNLASYAAIPLAFWINGMMLNHIRIERLYSFGMFLSAASMMVMMTLDKLNFAGLVGAGFLMSFSAGFFWANRDFLALSTTNDSTRSYYYGLDQFFNTYVTMISPAIIGSFIGYVDKEHWLGLDVKQAYQVVVGVVVILVICASWMIHQGNFKNPKKENFVFFWFHKEWKWLQLLTVIRGMAQGYMAMAPTLLIMTLIGNENAVGWINFGGGILSGIALYILGRTTGPQHRVIIYSTAVVVFAIGGLTNSVLYSAVGVFVFVACQTLSSPLQEISYFGTQMLLIDVTSYIQKRNQYAYIFNLEFSYLVGRCSGLLFFLVLVKYVDNTFALRYALAIVAIIQLCGIFLVRHILKKCEEEQSHEHNQGMAGATLNAELTTNEAPRITPELARKA